MDNAHFLTSFGRVAEAMQRGACDLSALSSHFLRRAAEHKELNAFIDLYEEEMKVGAQKLMNDRTSNKRGKLAGLVVGLKDLYCYKDHPLEASSKILKGFISQFSGTAVDRMIAEEALIMGRQNCDEFAMGTSNEYSIHGAVKNPFALDRVPGGSSGGSAAAVAAKLCHASLGTDTGGSVRQPAAFCGIVGFKPTYGRISRHGVIAYASSFDTVSIFAHDIEDCARLFEVIAGKDQYDNTMLDLAVPTYEECIAPIDKKLSIAYLRRNSEQKGVEEGVIKTLQKAVHFLKGDGHRVAEETLTLLDYALPTYYILTTAEASANLARYDGIRYGQRREGGDLEQLYRRTRTEGFGEEVKRRILLGTFVLSADYHNAYYVQAQKVRRLIIDECQQLLTQHDFILLPTTPTSAFPIGSHGDDPLQLYLADLYTVPFSIAGLPALSIPFGVNERGLPIGIQIVAQAGKEAELLRFAHYLLKEAPPEARAAHRLTAIESRS